jgi:pimeloyl-ACP methyl ester carboxylesterase
LRRLLTAARIAPPYVLVGHGMGTYHVRVFYRYYRSDVAGMVLADPFNEDTTIHVHNHVEAFRPAVIAIVRVLGFFGWFHLITDDPGAPPPGMTATEWATARAMVSQTKSIPARIAEPPLWISGELARAAGGFADLPLVVLSGEQHWEMYEDQDLSLEIKRHEELARRSSRGIHTVVEGSGHWNPYERPDALVDAVRQVVATARLR